VNAELLRDLLMGGHAPREQARAVAGQIVGRAQIDDDGWGEGPPHLGAAAEPVELLGGLAVGVIIEQTVEFGQDLGWVVLARSSEPSPGSTETVFGGFLVLVLDVVVSESLSVSAVGEAGRPALGALAPVAPPERSAPDHGAVDGRDRALGARIDAERREAKAS
jgi:hypothetical protein